jgi:hypothetical protein
MAMFMAIYAGDEVVSVNTAEEEKEERVQLLPNGRLFYAIIEVAPGEDGWAKAAAIGRKYKLERVSGKRGTS